MSLRALSECLHAYGNASTATIAVVPATPGKRVCIYAMLLSNAAAATLTVQDTSGAALSQTFQLPATAALPIILERLTDGDPWWSTTAGLGVQLGQGGTVNIGFDVWYQLLP